jgi:hypothetical protein
MPNILTPFVFIAYTLSQNIQLRLRITTVHPMGGDFFRLVLVLVSNVSLMMGISGVNLG